MNAAIASLDDELDLKDKEPGEITLERFSTDINTADWTWQRRLVAQVISHQITEVVLAVLVLCSLTMVIIETDDNAIGIDTPAWIEPIESLLLLVYVTEMTCRCYVLRTKLFVSHLNIVDFLIVLTDFLFFVIKIASIDLPNVAFFRILRLMRLSRAFHILASQQELALMMEGLVASLKTCLYGCVIISVAFLIFGILAVEFLHPLDITYSSNCGRCPRAFSSVFMSMTTFIQTVIVGDEFGTIFLPFIEEYPGTIIFILAVFVTVNFGLMNLIMAVIVDSAAQARAHNNKQIAYEKQKEFEQNQNKLRKICEDIDADGGGTISMPELLKAYREKLEFQRTLNAMDLEEEDLVAVYNILDEDNSGDVKYDEFVQQLWKMKSNNTNTMLVFIKHYVTELRKNVKQELVLMKDTVAGGIEALRSQVTEELTMLKKSMEVEKELEQRTGLIATETEEILKDESKMQVGDSMMPSPAAVSCRGILKSEPPATGVSPLPVDAMFATDVGIVSVADAGMQLQTVADQMTIALDALRCKIESSAALLNKFQTSLPCNPMDFAPQCSVGNSCKAAPDCGNVQLVSFEQSKSVCSAPSLGMEASTVPVKMQTGGLENANSLQDRPGPAVIDEDKRGKRTDGTEYVIMVTGCAGSSSCVDGPCNVDAGPSRCIDVMLPSSQPNTAPGCDDVDSAKVDAFSDARSEPSHVSRPPLLDHYVAQSKDADQGISSASPPCDLKYSFTFEDNMIQLGIEVYWMKDGLPLVGRVLPKSAAELRGLLPGDRLIECNGIAIGGKSREEVLQFLRVRPLQLMITRTDLY